MPVNKRLREKKRLRALKNSAFKPKKYDAFFVALGDPGASCLQFCLSLRTLGMKTAMLSGCGHSFQYSYYPAIYLPLRKRIYDATIDKYVRQSEFFFLNGYFNFKTFTTPSSINWKKTTFLANGHNKDSASARKNVYKKCPLAVVASANLSGYNPQKEILIQWPVSTTYIQPEYEFSHPTKITVGHHPSTQAHKGTPTIYKAIMDVANDPEYKEKINYIGDTPPFLPEHYSVKNKAKRDALLKKMRARHWPWKKQLEYYKKCDIYVETCLMKLPPFGKKFGTWGCSGFEIAASGTILITNNIYQDLYKKWYGDCPVYVANSGEDISKHLRYLLNLPREELLAEKMKFRQWVIDKHSFIPTAIKMWKHIMRPHFPKDKQLRIDKEVEKLEESQEYRDEVEVRTWNEIKREYKI